VIRRQGFPPLVRSNIASLVRCPRTTGSPLFLLAALSVLLAFASCTRKKPPLAASPNKLAAEFAAAARGAAGTESPIRIVPGDSARPARVLVSLPDSTRLSAIESAWQSAAEVRGVTLQPRDTAGASASYAVNSGARTLLVLELFQPAPPSAALAVPAGGAPKLAVIVDDLGYDPAAAHTVLALPARISVAVLPNLPDSPAIAEEAHRRGIQVLLHLPMESVAGEDKAEKIELHVGEPAGEVARVMDQMLATVPYAAGVNNHQGSRATSDPALMAAVAAALRARGLFFIDSRTASGSRALDAALRAGVPAAARNIFLDDEEQPAAIRRQLERAESLAREQGWCVAIGHPHPATLEVLAEMLPEVEARGVRLVSASDVVPSTAAHR
jgi:uncharacterized protein